MWRSFKEIRQVQRKQHLYNVYNILDLCALRTQCSSKIDKESKWRLVASRFVVHVHVVNGDFHQAPINVWTSKTLSVALFIVVYIIFQGNYCRQNDYNSSSKPIIRNFKLLFEQGCCRLFYEQYFFFTFNVAYVNNSPSAKSSFSATFNEMKKMLKSMFYT